jgi:hypothetical protein
MKRWRPRRKVRAAQGAPVRKAHRVMYPWRAISRKVSIAIFLARGAMD